MAPKPVQVLIVDRRINPTAWVSAEQLHLADESGTRAVWFWSASGDYGDAVDLPEEVFALIKMRCGNLERHGEQLSICMRREDPGLGIFIPEIDEPVLAGGGVPDGCIRVRA